MSGVSVLPVGLKRLIDRAVELYNRYRAPEAVARVVAFTGDRLLVEFRGSFCETCGINDWVEDFKYVLEDVGVEAELVEVVEPDDPFNVEEWRIGVFRIKGVREARGRGEG